MITIITAVKNSSHYLERTIQSVAHFQSNDIEYVVIDGNSNDGTVDIIRNHQKHIDYWISEPDDGLYEAYNKGWEIASNNSYILYLGAGDQLIKLPLKELDSNLNTIVYGRVDTGRDRLFVSRVSRMSMFANTIHHQAMLIPKKLHPTAPFDARYKVYADFDFNQRLIKNRAQFVYSNNFKTYAMPGGMSESYSKEAFFIAYKNFGICYGLLAFLFFLYQKGKRIRLLFQ